MRLIRKYIQPTRIFLGALFLFELLQPTTMFAITGADDMPEYKSFEPVATTNMVNNFDGSFTYNLSLIEVPNGYPVSLSYHSGQSSPESLASAVGDGFEFNVGSITRTKKGFPDEYNGETVTYHNRMPANWTIGVSGEVRPEIFGDEELLNLSLGGSMHYNNYTGIKVALTAGFSFAGVANLNMSFSQGRVGFNPSVNPFALLNVKNKIKTRKDRVTAEEGLTSKEKQELKNQRLIDEAEDSGNTVDAPKKKSAANPQIGFSVGNVSAGGGYNSQASGNKFSSSGSFQNTQRSYPSTLAKYSGYMVAVQIDGAVNWLPAPVTGEGSIEGTYSRQKNEDKEDKIVYGYMHNEKAIVVGKEATMMDYFTENEKPFAKRDNMLGYPLPNNDVYNLTGEATGGSFRAFRSEYGHYRKNKVRSDDFSVNAGGDIKLASNLPSPLPPPGVLVNSEYSAGVELGGAYHWSSVGNWKNPGNASSYNFGSGDERFFFNFSGDPAGYFDLSEGDDNYFVAKLDRKNGVNFDVVFDDWKTSLSSDWKAGNNLQNVYARSSGRLKRRSTYIDYHKTDDFSDKSKGVSYKVFEKNAHFLKADGTVVPYTHGDYTGGNGLGEIVSHNNDGVTYVYGLPVYAKNEKQLQYSLEKDDFDATDFNLTTTGGGGGLVAKVTKNIDESAKRKLGYESDAEYATTFLLTQILGPDYVDRTGDGPTKDDFGSYTKFNYTKVAGNGVNNDKWYPYRTPYEGVSYNYGSLSDNKDDMGSFSAGEKEIYYLHSIASKTHTAIFTMGDRFDGQSAPLSGSPTADELIKGTDETTSPIALKRLERIDLYSLEDCVNAGDPNEDIGIYKPLTGAVDAVAIKTVHFEHNYSLCKDIPNNLTEDPNNSPKTLGKLTLKKVWFEYEGKLTSKISPYIFHYKYPTAAEADFPTAYDGLENYGDYTAVQQNPDYNVLNSDRWGNYRDYGDLNTSMGDLSRFWPYVNQNPGTSFDPAAYQLKRITLPSQGEILIQYEPHDIQFVQDKQAMVMVPLKGTIDIDETGINGKKYYLDLDKIGIAYPSGTYEQRTLANDLFGSIDGKGEEIKKRMFFNFLYSIVGDKKPNFKTTNSEYIEGYARIDGYGYDASGIYFSFKNRGGGGSAYTAIDYPDRASKREIPQKVCNDFYKTQRRGKISGGKANALSDEGSALELVKDFLKTLESLTDVTGRCRVFDPAMSYVRVQMPLSKPKRGGGVRVKRLLMYNNGGDLGSGKTSPNTLYGQEYEYTTTTTSGQVISSGVASNEPANGRRESPLVQPIAKDPQSGFSALLYGRDMYGQEGPIGESLLPGASIGYSKVTIKSIHQGVTSTGTETHEFYTYRDYPFKAERSQVYQGNKQSLGANGGAAGISAGYTRKAPYLTQGYVFKSYAMHGQPLRKAKYAHDMPNKPMAEEIYEYFKAGDPVDLMGGGLLTSTVDYEQLGKTSEILSEMRQVTDYSVSGNIGLDKTGPNFIMSGTPPLPIPTPYQTKIKGGVSINEEIYRTHVTSKIINYPVLVKKITNKADGVTHVTENIMFDFNTGKPVVVKSYDDFTGTYLNQDFMASWEYGNMRATFMNENYTVGVSAGTTITYRVEEGKGFLEVEGDNSCGTLVHFTRGDFIELSNINSSKVLYHIDDIDLAANRLYIVPSQFANSTFTGGENVTGIHVVKSGYTNQLSAKMGNIMFFSEDGTKVPFEGDVALTQNSAFVLALNAQLAVFNCPNCTDSPVPLTGTFNMSIVNYAAQIPSACSSVNLNNASIFDVVLYVTTLNDQMTIKIASFKLNDCTGGTVVINACEPL